MHRNDCCILDTHEPNGRPYNPQQFAKEVVAFCKMNNSHCTFHDLRHVFATITLASCIDIRTAASYLGHANESMTLNIYADVDADAKCSAVRKLGDAFDVDMSSIFAKAIDEPTPAFKSGTRVHGRQLRAPPAEAERREKGTG